MRDLSEEFKSELREEFKLSIESFLSSPVQNVHLKTSVGVFYVRKGYHAIFNDIETKFFSKNTFDVASISIEEQFQNKGVLKLFLSVLSSINTYRYIYIESVQNPLLYLYLQRNDWCTNDNQCFYQLNSIVNNKFNSKNNKN